MQFWEPCGSLELYAYSDFSQKSEWLEFWQIWQWFRNLCREVMHTRECLLLLFLFFYFFNYFFANSSLTSHLWVVFEVLSHFMLRNVLNSTFYRMSRSEVMHLLQHPAANGIKSRGKQSFSEKLENMVYFWDFHTQDWLWICYPQNLELRMFIFGWE